MKILITGGAGYLGSTLVGRLLGMGHNVTVIDNFMYDQQSLNQYCRDYHFDVVNGDVRDERVILPLLKKSDLVIPLACIVGAPACDRDQNAAVSVNCGAIDLMVKNLSNEQQVIIPTTNSGYGIGDKDKECTEDSPLNPISLYGRTKVAAEKAVLSRSNSISLRLATVFGVSPRMRLDLLVNDFVYRAVTDKAVVLFEAHFRRNYIHIMDVASAFTYAMSNFDTMKNMAFNIGLSDANLTKAQLCDKIKEHVPGFVYLEASIGEDPDKRDYTVSNARVEGYGFRPTRTIDYGIEELLKGYRMLRIRSRAFSNV